MSEPTPGLQQVWLLSNCLSTLDAVFFSLLCEAGAQTPETTFPRPLAGILAFCQ